MKQILLFTCLALGLSATSVYGQVQPETYEPTPWEEFRSRLFFQPGGSFFVANQTMVVGLSPSVGYRVLPKTSVGLGPSVVYARNFATDANYYEWGGSVFVRQRLGERFFLQTEYEQINRPVLVTLPGGGLGIERQWVPGFLVGGGLFQPIGYRGGFMAALFYNLLWDPNRSNTASPLITRFGFVF